MSHSDSTFSSCMGLGGECQDLAVFSQQHDLPPPAPMLFLLLAFPVFSATGEDSFEGIGSPIPTVAPSICDFGGNVGIQSGSSASLVHCGQNHSPSGTADNGGERHPR